MKNLNDRFQEFLETLGVDFSTSKKVLKTYEDGMTERLKAKHPFLSTFKPGFPLRPSSALACGRRLYYELSNWKEPGTYPTEPNSFRMDRVFNAGHMFEEFELSRLNSLKQIKIAYQQEKLEIATVDGQTIYGSIDAMLFLNGNMKKAYLIDIKSITTYQFGDIRDTAIPKLPHVAQLSLYACSPGMRKLMESAGIEEIKIGVFYVNKDNLTYTMVEFDPNPNIHTAIIKRFTAVSEAHKKGQIVPRDFAELRYPCNYCMFKAYCIKDDPDTTIQVDQDIDDSLPETEKLLALWQHGDARNYQTPSTTYRVEMLKTKWKLHADTQEKKAPRPRAKRKARAVRTKM